MYQYYEHIENGAAMDQFQKQLQEALLSLASHVREKAVRHPTVMNLFTFDRNGLRLAIASIDDENNELYEEWSANKNTPANAREEIQHELLDVAMCAILAYMGTRANV